MSVMLYLLKVLFLIKILVNWDLNFYFLKSRRVNIFNLYMVLIIWNVLIEFIVFKKVSVNVV